MLIYSQTVNVNLNERRESEVRYSKGKLVDFQPEDFNMYFKRCFNGRKFVKVDSRLPYDG